MANKRVIYRVHYVGREKVWRVTVTRIDGVKERFATTGTKASAVWCAVDEARARWRLEGELTQVVVHSKDKQLVCFERTYGKDPRRSKG